MINDSNPSKQFLDFIIKNNIKVIEKDKVIFSNDINNVIKVTDFAQIYKGKYLENDVSVYVYFNTDLKNLQEEVLICSKVEHPNLTKFYGVLNDDKEIIIIFSYINGEILENVNVGSLDENQKIQICLDISSSLKYLHENNLIHRNINLGSIIIENKTSKAFLTDFSIAKEVKDSVSVLTRAKGGLLFMAPEVFNLDEFDDDGNKIGYVTPKADIWALGCVISYLFSGHLPWCNKYDNKDVVIMKCLSKKKQFPVPNEILNKRIKQVVAFATEINEGERYDISQIYELFIKIAEDLKFSK